MKNNKNTNFWDFANENPDIILFAIFFIAMALTAIFTQKT